MCRAGRGDPASYTYYSEPKFVLSGGFHSSASLTVSPDRAQHFTSDSVSLSCEGNSTEWRVRRLSTEDSYLSDCTIWGTMNGSTCNIDTYRPSDAVYWCESGSREFSNAVNITIRANRPKAELRADDRDIPVGGSVTLTCSVNQSSSGWKYFWYRGEKPSEHLTTQLSAGRIRVSEEGVYWCRGGRGEPVNYTEYSDPITINKIIHNKAVVTLQPNWSEIYRGETITLRCEIKDGGDTEWEYEWKTTSKKKTISKKTPIFKTQSHRGDYRCKGRNKSEKSSTDWSDPFKLRVSNKPRPVLTVSPSWLSAGASVTLNCSVKDPSAGWRFYWYKTVPDPSNYFYSIKLLPGSSSGTEQDSYIVHGQTHTAEEMENQRNFHSSASLTVSPDRAQHFTSDSVSLSCEGNSTEWRVRRLTEDSYLSDCTIWGTMNGSTCNIDTDRPSDAVYWCESGSGEFSNAVNITIQKRPRTSPV
ncbi:Fc receptor-like protein 5 [Pagrus major]|uniref:Fc receptor-like protein 5 n=1 Tax=Pagrus major TaxID=143350 RepID=UPI003CC85790